MEHPYTPDSVKDTQHKHPIATDSLPQNTSSGWLAFSNDSYLKGFLAGAGVTFLLTNKTLQKAIIKGTVKLWTTIQGGVEEVKEQIQDVKAEMGQGEE